MQLELNIKYCVFFSNKTYLRDSCLLVLALTFALLSVTPSSVVKLCCRPNLCKDLTLGRQKKPSQTFSPGRTIWSWLTHLHEHVYGVRSVQRQPAVLLEF